MEIGLLSYLLILPLLGIILVYIFPSKYAKWISILVLSGVFLVSLLVYKNFDLSISSYQFVEHFNWFQLKIGSLNSLKIDYILGIDGISLPLVLLSSLVLLIGSIASFTIPLRPKTYYTFYLLLSASVLGTFISLDFFLFFLFFEFMLLPMFFLIGIWGGENREYAALKFLIYTLVGSIFILIVMIALAMSYQNLEGIHVLDFRVLADTTFQIKESSFQTKLIFGKSVPMVLFILLLIGFGIKLPMVPFHTWLPDAHVEAATPISVVLAGILLKVGGYGLIRIGYQIFPDPAQELSYIIAGLGVISIIYGALVALAQDDLKKLVAYASVSHMGFVLLALGAYNAEGLNAAVFQMVSHGVLSSMLFLCVGVIYSRAGSRRISNFRGLAKPMPIFTLLITVAFFGSLGLPGLSGFIGEFFSVYAAFNSTEIPIWLGITSVLGIILAAVYFLWALQRMFFGQFWVNLDKENEMVDLNHSEFFLLAVLAFISISLGVYPNLIFNMSHETIQYFFNK